MVKAFLDGDEVSLPVRGAWVEIATYNQRRKDELVAPRAGSVG